MLLPDPRLLLLLDPDAARDQDHEHHHHHHVGVTSSSFELPPLILTSGQVPTTMIIPTGTMNQSMIKPMISTDASSTSSSPSPQQQHPHHSGLESWSSLPILNVHGVSRTRWSSCPRIGPGDIVNKKISPHDCEPGIITSATHAKFRDSPSSHTPSSHVTPNNHLMKSLSSSDVSSDMNPSSSSSSVSSYGMNENKGGDQVDGIHHHRHNNIAQDMSNQVVLPTRVVHTSSSSFDDSEKKTFVRLASIPCPPVLLTVRAASGPLGIHVVPYCDPVRGGRTNGIIIEKIEPNGRVFKEGRFQVEDWIIEVNGQSLLGCHFDVAQDIFKEALKLSPEVHLKVIQKRSRNPFVNPYTATSLPPTPTSCSFPPLPVSSSCTTPLIMSRPTSSNHTLINGHQPNHQHLRQSSTSSYTSPHPPNNSSRPPLPQVPLSSSSTPSGSTPLIPSSPLFPPSSPLKSRHERSISNTSTGSRGKIPPKVLPKPTLDKIEAAIVADEEEEATSAFDTKNKTSFSFPSTSTSTYQTTPSKSNPELKSPSKSSSTGTDMTTNTMTTPAPNLTSTPVIGGSCLVSGNTRKMGKKYHMRIVKRANGLGFSITTRDNPAGGHCPIYIKNILPKGSAIADGRLKQGDRLLEVNGTPMTGKSQEEAVQLLKAITVGKQVDLIVSRQECMPLDPLPSPQIPRPIPKHKLEQESPPNTTTDPQLIDKQREVLRFVIPLNDTGSAGLGLSVKGRTRTPDGSSTTIDSGIFVKSVITGGAASKDGRLQTNDQLITINSISLLGLSNSEAMETLRRAMLDSNSHPDHPGLISLTVTRRVHNLNESVTIMGVNEREIATESEIRSRNEHNVTLSGGKNIGFKHVRNSSILSNVSDGEEQMLLSPPPLVTPAGESYGGSFFPPSPSTSSPSSSGHHSRHHPENDQQMDGDVINMSPHGDHFVPSNDNTVIFNPNGSPLDASMVSNEHIDETSSPLDLKHQLDQQRHPMLDRLTSVSSSNGTRGSPSMTRTPLPNKSVSTSSSVFTSDFKVPAAPMGEAAASTHESLKPGESELSIATTTQETDGEDPFQRDGFGRQSMSEKRHAQLDAKSTDTFQRSLRRREDAKKEKERVSREEETPARNSGRGRGLRPRAKSAHGSRSRDPNDLEAAVTPQCRTKVATKSLFSPVCCFTCQSPGTCPYHPASPETNRMGTACTNPNNQCGVGDHSIESRAIMRNGVGHAATNGRIRRSSSLENLDQMMENLQRQRLEQTTVSDPYASRNGSSLRVARSRVTNESFRAAVDRSYDAAPNPDQDPMETVQEEGSESGSSIHHQQQQQLQQQQPSTSNGIQPSNQNHFLTRHTLHQSLRNSRPSAAALSMHSQATVTTAFSTMTAATNATSTTATSVSTTTDEDSSLIGSGGKIVPKKKPGVLSKLFKFGSKKAMKAERDRSTSSMSCVPSSKPVASMSEMIEELESDVEKMRAKEHAVSEQMRIAEHVRRLKDQQNQKQQQQHHQQHNVMSTNEQLQSMSISGSRTKPVSNQQHQLQQQQQQHSNVEIVEDDKYGHYMNFNQIQQQIQQFGSQPSHAIAQGQPQGQGHHVTPNAMTMHQMQQQQQQAIYGTRQIPNGRMGNSHTMLPPTQRMMPPVQLTRGPPQVFRRQMSHPVKQMPRPVSNYYEYEGVNRVPQPIYGTGRVGPGVAPKPMPPPIQNNSHYSPYSTSLLPPATRARPQYDPRAYEVVIPDSGHYGMISQPGTATGGDGNIFRRQLSNHRIQPTQSVPTMMRAPPQPVYQQHNNYIYSNSIPNQGFGAGVDGGIYGTTGMRGQPIYGESPYGYTAGLPPPGSRSNLQVRPIHQPTVDPNSYYGTISQRNQIENGSNV